VPMSNTPVEACVARQQDDLLLVGEVDPGQSQPTGSPLLPPAGFAARDNFPDSWDFDAVWIIPEGAARPLLRWQQ